MEVGSTGAGESLQTSQAQAAATEQRQIQREEQARQEQASLQTQSQAPATGQTDPGQRVGTVVNTQV